MEALEWVIIRMLTVTARTMENRNRFPALLGQDVVREEGNNTFEMFVVLASCYCCDFVIVVIAYVCR